MIYAEHSSTCRLVLKTTLSLSLVVFMCNQPTCNFFAYYYQQYGFFFFFRILNKEGGNEERSYKGNKMFSPCTVRDELCFGWIWTQCQCGKVQMYSTCPQKNNLNLPEEECKMSCSCWPVCTFVQPWPFNAAKGFSPQAESTESGGLCRGVVCKWSGLEDLLSVAGYAVSVISNDCRDLWWNSFFFPFYILSHLKNRGTSRNLRTRQTIFFYSCKSIIQHLKMAKMKWRIYTRCMTTANCIY